MRKTLRVTGWGLIALGVLVALYVVYLLWFTNLTTARAQDQLSETWTAGYGDPTRGSPTVTETPSESPSPDESPAPPPAPGDAYAVLWFERDGERIVHDEPLFVVEGVSVADLREGPGHYPGTVAPGDDGNVGISGHRTTYGAPFYDLQVLADGDEVHLVDRDGVEHVYEVVDDRIVGPTDVWVLEDDPLDRDAPMLTLTTCHPRFSAAQRLIVFAELTSA